MCIGDGTLHKGCHIIAQTWVALLLAIGFFDKASAKLAGVVEVYLEVFVAVVAFVFFAEEVEVVATVVVELISVVGVEGFAVAENVLHYLGVFLKDGRVTNLLHVVFRTVHGENHGSGDDFVPQCDVATVLVQVSANREDPAFHEGT